MRAKYQIIFSVEVLNKYFNTGRWSSLSIKPLPETEQLLKSLEYGYRQIDNELLIIGKTDKNGKIIHPLPAYAKLQFSLQPLLPNYMQYSNYEFAQLNTPLYYFHNLHNNEAAAKHYLTTPIELYSASADYHPATMAKSLADGKIYESIRLNPSGPGSVAPDNAEAEPALPADPEAKKYSANYWALLGDEQFVTRADTGIVWNGSRYYWDTCAGIYAVKTAIKKKNHEIQVYGLNPATNAYNQLLFSDVLKFGEDRDELQIDLRTLPSGVYRVQANEEVHFVWLNKNNKSGNREMFIEIYNLPSTAPQSFFDAANKPRRTRFTISFAARRVLWQYKTRTGIIDKIEDSDGNYLFKSNGLRRFVSLRPIPFSDVAMKSLVAKSGTLAITSPLPNPQADKLGEAIGEIYSSEAFINF